MSSTVSRIPSLDGMRAVSIALVIVSHYCREVNWGDPFGLGLLGVRVFFIISGYLITGLLLKELDRDGSISLLRFYYRRTMRIFPAFYVYLASMLLISALGWSTLSFRAALPALTYTSNYFGPSLHGLIRHTWSLATEEQFYLIWPAALALSGRRRGLIVLIALMIFAPLAGHFLSQYFGHSVPAFFNSPIGIGCLFAMTREALHKRKMYRLLVHSKTGLLLPLIILGASLAPLHTGGLRDEFASLVANIAIAFWLDWAMVNAGSLVGGFLNHRFVIYIGVLSYSIYLWQQPLLGTSDAVIMRGAWQLLRDPIVELPVVALCAGVSYYLVERPMLRLRAQLEPKWFSDGRRTPASIIRINPEIKRVEA
jgi:peptidoglycan/LPS O-acetylase OafA/YrhL